MKKKLTKKQIIIISVACVLLLAIIATAITVPLVLLNGNTGIPEPYIDTFDQLNDMYVTVKWEKVSNASDYTVQYCYGNVIDEEDSIISVKTTGLYHRIERQKGILSYRVKRNADGDTQYSEWQYFNVNALILGSTSNIVLNSEGVLSWKNVKYLDRETSKTVPTYIIDFTISGDLLNSTFTLSKTKSDTNTLDIKSYIINMILYDEEEDVWSDVTLTVKIKSLNYFYYGSITTIEGYEFLYNAYDESEYYEQVITIDENLYKNIKG